MAVQLPFAHADPPLSIDYLADRLQQAIQSAGMVPPVLVAHSLSSFVAQRFLESYPLAGLVLVNPIPDDPAHCATTLRSWWRRCEDAVAAEEQAVCSDASSEKYRRSLFRYYCGDIAAETGSADTVSTVHHHSVGSMTGQLLSDCALGGEEAPVSAQLLESLASDPAQRVRLEPRSVPMLVVISAADGPHVSAAALEALLHCHDIQAEDVVKFADDHTRLSMLHSHQPSGETGARFNEVVLDWIERL